MITSVASFAPGEFSVTWQLSEYLNGDRSRRAGRREGFAIVISSVFFFGGGVVLFDVFFGVIMLDNFSVVDFF